MNRVALCAFVVVACCGGLLARAEETAAPRKTRAPADYSGRVQLHELPATVAPPKLPDPKDDPLRIESRSPSSPFGERSIAPSMIPPAPGAPADESPSTVRDLINENWRGGDSRGGSTGWGWLADDIATNRARRAARDTDRPRDDRLDDREQSSLLQTNVGAPGLFTLSVGPAATNAPTARPGDVRPALEPLLGWVQNLPAGADARGERDRDDAGMTGRREAGNRDSDRARQGNDPTVGWGMAPVLESRASDGFSAVLKPEEPVAAAPAQPAYDARRMAGDEPGWTASGSSDAAAQSTLWPAPSFTPFALTPTEPLAIEPTPISVSVGFGAAESTTPSLGGMGSEREQAAPKTLPW